MRRLPFHFNRILLSAMLCLGMAAQAHAQSAPAADGGIPGCPYMAGPYMHGPMVGMESMMGQGMMAPGMMGPGMRMGPGMGQFHGGAMMPYGGMMGMGGMGGAFLYGLQLSEEQQDRVYNIKHKQEPRFRESMKQLQKSMIALHQLSRAGNYTDANAQALARSIGQASADLALLHAQTERQIYEVLTPEQRRQLEERVPGPRNRPGCAVSPGSPAPRR